MLGTNLENVTTITEAVKICYPHQLLELPLEARCGEATTVIDSHKAIIRDDGQQIGIVGQGYHLQQAVEAMAIFDPYLETGRITLMHGGELNDGKRLFMVGQIASDLLEAIPGDKIAPYILLATGFDGSLSYTLKAIFERLWCKNQLAVMFSGKQQKDNQLVVKAKHTRNLDSKIAEADQKLDQMLASYEHMIEVYRSLATKQMTRSLQESYIEAVFDPKAGTDDYEQSTKMENKITHVIDLLDSQKGLEHVPAIRNTAWQAYNAVTEYLTHEYGRTEDSRLNANFFGAAANLNNKALEYAVQA